MLKKNVFAVCKLSATRILVPHTQKQARGKRIKFTFWFFVFYFIKLFLLNLLLLVSNDRFRCDVFLRVLPSIHYFILKY